jgi:eukaryotic-like serine/threonine-protein kinase
MNHKAHEPNGPRVGSPADNETVADLLIAYDEALRTGRDLPDETAKEAELEPKARERLETAKDCLRLIERVRQFRRNGTKPLSIAIASMLKHNTYTATGDLHRIGRFEIMRELGRGSHGIVFLARDPALNREIALKVPRPEAILTPQLRSRFLREGKAAARLNHPNILPVHEAGEAGAICYLVQSYCSGPTLAAWLAGEKNSVPCNVAALIVAELADGAEHAHKQGILHRDIKPANVMMEILEGRHPEKTDGARFNFTPRLTDFGLAKALDDDPNATATLGAVGTANYMPPEQATGQMALVGPRSDVYSLGSLLYEILTRHPPISGANQLETLCLIASQEPRPLRALRGDVPRDLEAVCLKCLEKLPEQRYPTAADLADDLRRFLNGVPVIARPQSRVRRIARRVRRQLPRRLASGIVAMLAVGGLLIGLSMISRPRANSTGRDAQLPFDPAGEYVLGLDRVALGYYDAVANRGNTQRAVDELETFLERHRPQPGEADYRGFEWHYLWRLCHPEKVAKSFRKLLDLKGHTGEVYFATFSPDGSLLATAGKDRIGRIWDATTGRLHATLVGHTDEINWITFFPDRGIRRVLTASDDKTIRIWDCDSGHIQAVVAGHKSKVVCVEVITVEHREGDFSKSGYEIVSGDHDGHVFFWDWLSGKPLHSIPAHGNRIEAIDRFPGKDRWITASTDRTAKEWHAAGNTVRAYEFDTAVHGVSVDSQGTLAAFASGVGDARGTQRDSTGSMVGGRIFVNDLESGQRWATLGGPPAGGYESARFYPGRSACVAVSRDKDHTSQRNWNVVFWDIPTQRYWNPTTGDHPGCWCAAFSPSGDRMATAGNDGVVRVWDSSALPSGTRLPEQHGDVDRIVGSIRYSPDGQKLLATRYHLGQLGMGNSFVEWDVAGDRPRPVRAEPTAQKRIGCAAAAYSDNGRLIAVSDTVRSGKRFTGEIRVLQADSAHEIARSSGYDGIVRSVAISTDSKTVVSATRDEPWNNARLYVWNVDRPAPKRFRESKGNHFLTTVRSPDGRLLATNEDQVELFEFPSMKFVGSLPIQLGNCGAIAFSPNSKTLAAGGEGGTIHLWDIGTGAKVADLHADEHAILSLAFSPDGTRLAAGLAGTPRVDLWHVQSGKRLAPLALLSDSQSVGDLAFSPDQRTLAAAGLGRMACVFLFPLEPVDGVAR